MKRFLLPLLIAFAALSLSLLAAPEASAQCPMCKYNVNASMKSPEDAVGRGLNEGIIYLLITPYVLAGTVGVFAYRWHRKKKRAERALENDQLN